MDFAWLHFICCLHLLIDNWFALLQLQLELLLSLTSSHVDEVLPRGFVHLDVSVANVMLVSPERHVPVGDSLKQYHCLAIPPSLW